MTAAQNFYQRPALSASTINSFEALLQCLDPMGMDGQQDDVTESCEHDEFYDAVEEIA
jgi:hypothetical protein